MVMGTFFGLAAGGDRSQGVTGTPSAPPFSAAVSAGPFVYLSGMMPTDQRRQVVPGDIRVQTRRVLDNLRTLLVESGSSLEQVASVHVYLTRASDFQAMNEVFASYWPKEPPARTTVIANLVLPGALVEMSMVAVRNGVERRVVHPDGWPRSPNPYSYGITSGDTLFLSGLVPRRGRDNAVIDGDIATQTRVVLDNAREIAAAAGMSLKDVVAARVYITDTAGFQAMNGAYRPFFPEDPPARATVRAGLTNEQFLVEIGLVAVRSADRTIVAAPGPDGRPAPPNPNLSPAIRAGNRLFVSGTLGNTAANRADAGAQTKEALARIGRTLQAGGFGWHDVVDGVVYLTDTRNFGAMNDAYRPFFGKRFPARATVETGLVAPDGLVEIMLLAAR
jgi:2-iminobutanoate/2-iminopropanoate deaminase